jgi:hypothetical protein
MGVVFMGTGVGTQKNTRGLPVSCLKTPESNNNRLNPRGHCMPHASITRHPTPGVLEAAENHCAAMHECLLSLIRQHLSTRLQIPQGTKVRKTDSESIGTFSGSANFGDLEYWLTNLVTMLEAEQYGGSDRDRECCLQLLSFVSGEAKRWYHRHTVSINR